MILRLKKLLYRRDDAALKDYLEETLRVSTSAITAYRIVDAALDSGIGIGDTLQYVSALFDHPRSAADTWVPAPEPPWPDWPHPAIIYGGGHRLSFAGWPWHPGESADSIAGRIIENITNDNSTGTSRQLLRTPSGFEYRDRSKGLISVIYRHLGDLLVGNRVKLCEYCDLPFKRTHANQRFCPTEKGKRSLCEMRSTKAEQRRQAKLEED